MSDLIIVEKLGEWQRLKALVLDSVSSPITRRLYNMALDEFMTWFQQEPRPGFTKATVSAWRVSLEARGLGSSSISVRLSALRKLAGEAADNGLLSPELAAGIVRVKGVKSKGIRVGNWLSLAQSQALVNAPDTRTAKGLRDRAILAILLGCGLRRSEVAALTFAHIQQRDGRWCVVDLVGKHGRVRTVPMPTWVKVAIDAWVSAAKLTDGCVFRPVNRGDCVVGEHLGEKVVWQMLRCYAAEAGVPGIAPHDARRYAESRIMPNRCEGHSFGVALQINAAALIRHNPKESETIQKEQQVFIRLIADRTLALIGVVLERTFCKNRCSVLVFGLVEIVADGTVGSRSRLSAPREAGSPTDGHPPVYPDYAESFTAACTAGAAPLSPFGIIRDSA